ncbi:hypothetical protein AB0D78_24395 [Streptomyces avermitilis]|uniref:hypothetical protein n=1 Tax=Streptomyces avermitilis TaxID=33903 RepID=UPI0033ECFA67
MPGPKTSAAPTLYDSRPLDAPLAATRGLAVAPRDDNAAVRLSAQVARAHARLGNQHEFERATVEQVR